MKFEHSEILHKDESKSKWQQREPQLQLDHGAPGRESHVRALHNPTPQHDKQQLLHLQPKTFHYVTGQY